MPPDRVCCSASLAADVLQAGHPELHFELDGQCVTQPRHWREREDSSGPKLWLTGQAVALREMSWQLQRNPDAAQRERWQALMWLLGKTPQWTPEVSSLAALPLQPTPETLERARGLSDQLARRAAGTEWSSDLTAEALKQLLSTVVDFKDPAIPRTVQARRAERLALALDRLFMALPDRQKGGAGESELEAIFQAVQSLPDFAPEGFARHLTQFAEQLGERRLRMPKTQE